MIPRLDQLFRALEVQRSELLNSVKNSSDKFNLDPGNNKWTLHQVLAHLVAAERLSVQYLAKKIQGIDDAGDTGLIEDFKLLILKASQRLPLKYNAPVPVVASTSSYPNLEELVADWDNTRETLKNLLEKIKEDQLKRKIFKHVLVGKLNIQQALQFLGEHMTHHLPQINRLLK